MRELLKKFNEEKFYRIKTYRELENQKGVYKDNGLYLEGLTANDAYYFYTREMDDIKDRVFRGSSAYKNVYDLNFHTEEADFVVEPWMCEEI